jgi:UDP-N-acetylglucosamine 4,6-dehydratase
MEVPMFDNQAIFVSGGTGSFGHKFVETILQKFNPSRLVIYSRDELKQFEMRNLFKDERIRFFIGDVRDFERLKTGMRGIDFVVHAAALKQVPAAEYNPLECIKTNIHGAENIIKAAIENSVKKVVALSTDKAANPVNLYGATKLASDKLFVAANNMSGGKHPMFSIVRYGNVIGSRGSVVPFFQSLIDKGQNTLPVTDEKMTRFWLTLEEGVGFVLSSFERMKGGEIFVPKIPSVRIMDLARAMSPTGQTEIIGVRPGEKMHEIMVPIDDSHLTLEFKRHYVIRPTIEFDAREVRFDVDELGERGFDVEKDFEYNSCNNRDYLSFESLYESYGNDGLYQKLNAASS